MTTRPFRRLGELQLKILRVLWDAGEARVMEVHRTLRQKPPLAHTTVATMLRKMEARGLVRHREEGRRFVYQPAVKEDEVSQSMADHLLDRVFSGNVSALFSHLLSNKEVSAEELKEMEAMIRAKRRKG